MKIKRKSTLFYRCQQGRSQRRLGWLSGGGSGRVSSGGDQMLGSTAVGRRPRHLAAQRAPPFPTMASRRG